MDRPADLARLASESFDLLVIGGGVTGAGIAWDAALRGLSVALVEKDDFASGTSSRSSKLIHGGLRYLRHLEVGIVREGLRERAANEWMAPHLVRRTSFIVPLYASRHLAIRLGLVGYDILAAGSHYPRHRTISSDRGRELAPALRDSPRGIQYWDATADDARLVWTIVRSATAAGAVAVNHCRVVELLRTNGRVVGARIRDEETGSTGDVRARAVINATGVWSDEIRRMDDGRRTGGAAASEGRESSDASPDLRPSKGIHIVLRSDRVPLDTALLLPAPEGRFVFVVPWEDGCVIAGTTDEFYDGPLDDPTASEREIDYLLGIINGVLDAPVDRDDVVSTYAGLRALVGRDGRSKDISRRHLVEVGPGGVVTIAGGKLTAWRSMAVGAVDLALRSCGFETIPSSKTTEERLAGASLRQGVVPALEAVLDDLGLPRDHAARLYHRYGSLATEVLRLVRSDASLGQPLHPHAAPLRAEAEYAIRSEAARTTTDVLERRLRLALTTRDGGASALEWLVGRLPRDL